MKSKYFYLLASLGIGFIILTNIITRQRHWWGWLIDLALIVWWIWLIRRRYKLDQAFRKLYEEAGIPLDMVLCEHEKTRLIEWRSGVEVSECLKCHRHIMVRPKLWERMSDRF